MLAKLFHCVLAVVPLLLCLPSQAGPAINFDRDIRPILSDNCFQCHGPDAATRKGNLRLDTEEGAFAVVDGAAVVLPGKPNESALVERIESADPAEQMPPPEAKKNFNDAQRALLRQWIAEGAHWSAHWAFVPPAKVALPMSKFDTWARNPIDSFIASRLEEMGLAPSPEASRSTLIRRLALDLTGLPPTPEETARFMADSSPDAYERLVERLLASPHYGERMAWPWLDAARYADTNGYQGDNERTMHPWRDWVIEAFNRNMPYDQFTIEQLAGDLLPDATKAQKLATAFNRNHMINGEGGRIPEENRIEYVFDQLESVGTVWMGLTFNCCRCHDHKYDPLTNKDYYQLFAFFNQTSVDGAGGDPKRPPNLAFNTAESEARLARLQAEISGLERPMAARRTELEPLQPDWETATLARLASSPPADDAQKELASLLATPGDTRDEATKKKIAEAYLHSDTAYRSASERLKRAKEDVKKLDADTVKVMVMEDMAETRKTFMLKTGLYNQPGEEVSAAVPEFLFDMADDAPRNRLGLARWLTDPRHPLMARVTVNRIWAEFFGKGLVKTTENFGAQGEKPSHPELLDWLAVDFIERGWDVKALVRLMVTSATYRQSSDVDEGRLAIDPENRFLSRGARFRMPSWMIRDQALAAGGLLFSKLGGPPVKPYQPDGLWQEFSFGNLKYEPGTGEDLYRRSLYTYWRRIVAPPMFFDSSTRQTCSVKAPRTNTPLHALATLNDPTYVEAARAMAERLLLMPGATDRSRIDAAFRYALTRPAGEEEIALLEKSIARLRREFATVPETARAYLAVGESTPTLGIAPTEHAAYAALCLSILNTDEALTKE
jgi:hypothetical protein